MNLEWKAAELDEFVRSYKSDNLNVYTDIDDNTLMLCFEFKPNPPESKEIRNHIIQKCIEKFSWFNIKDCSEHGDITYVAGTIPLKPNPNWKTYIYPIVINNV
ncbi:hypothetical protein IAC76_05930 [Spirochaetes bacterium]|uniref:Uncharacterized protein n=1 Tax=Candidatus Scatousia excrementipullorum TaxID=2840936 RepID=A0A9D9GZT9_9BACT|nr:hypothetical protein [Candidatus Scatousia excrementipullorum]